MWWWVVQGVSARNTAMATAATELASQREAMVVTAAVAVPPRPVGNIPHNMSRKHGAAVSAALVASCPPGQM